MINHWTLVNNEYDWIGMIRTGHKESNQTLVPICNSSDLGNLCGLAGGLAGDWLRAGWALAGGWRGLAGGWLGAGWADGAAGLLGGPRARSLKMCILRCKLEKKGEKKLRKKVKKRRQTGGALMGPGFTEARRSGIYFGNCRPGVLLEG